MPISADILRGHTDTIILAQLMKKDSYGYEINKSIQVKTNGAYGFKEATLYTAFKRLEQSGMITSYWGEESQKKILRDHRGRPQPVEEPFPGMEGDQGTVGCIDHSGG